MFYHCYSLVSIPQLNTAKVTNMGNMFYYCYSLVSIPQLDTSSVTSMSGMFYYCYSLVSIPQLNTAKVTSMSNMFGYCYSLVYANIKNNKIAISFDYSPLLSKESLLYLINNEASTAAFAITLKSYAYDKWSVDADVVVALEAHTNVSLTRKS